MRFTWRLRPSWIVSSIVAGEAPDLRRSGLAVVEVDALGELSSGVPSVGCPSTADT